MWRLRQHCGGSSHHEEVFGRSLILPGGSCRARCSSAIMRSQRDGPCLSFLSLKGTTRALTVLKPGLRRLSMRCPDPTAVKIRFWLTFIQSPIASLPLGLLRRS